MARTKQTARKSTVRVVPYVSDDDDDAAVVVVTQGTKRAREDEPNADANDRPTKRQTFDVDLVLRNKIHWRIHSLATVITEHCPAMLEYHEHIDRIIENAKDTIIEDLETMLKTLQ